MCGKFHVRLLQYNHRSYIKIHSLQKMMRRKLFLVFCPCSIIDQEFYTSLVFWGEFVVNQFPLQPNRKTWNSNVTLGLCRSAMPRRFMCSITKMKSMAHTKFLEIWVCTRSRLFNVSNTVNSLLISKKKEICAKIFSHSVMFSWLISCGPKVDTPIFIIYISRNKLPHEMVQRLLPISAAKLLYRGDLRKFLQKHTVVVYSLNEIPNCVTNL